MNEPKKSEIEAAARKKWPTMDSFYVNQRKHILRVTLPLVVRKDGKRVRPYHGIIAGSHRELLAALAVEKEGGGT